MLLSEIFEQLALGELANHKYGKEGVIQAHDFPALITHTNLALLELYKKFPLRTKELQIRQLEALKDYTIAYDYADSNAESESLKYIIDTEQDPFMDDLIRIDGVYNECGEVVPLNEETQEHSIFKTGFNKIQIPFAKDGDITVLIYRAKHSKIPVSAIPSEVVVEVPETLNEPLLSYIAARCYSSLNSQTGNATSSFYFSKYNAMCETIKDEDLLNENHTTTNTKLITKGFV